MEHYAIIVAPRAIKQISKLPQKIKTKIANALEELSYNVFLGKPLKAQLKGLHSYRIGDYRIIYNISRRILRIEIIKVAHRRDVYS